MSYFLLHAAASSPLPVAKTPQDIGQLATSGIWRGLAYAGQYILPLLCMMGALASAIRRRERRAQMMTHIPYKSSPQQITDMIAGVAPLGFVQIATAAPQIKAGKLLAYATTGDKRSAQLPQVPTGPSWACHSSPPRCGSDSGGPRACPQRSSSA